VKSKAVGTGSGTPVEPADLRSLGKPSDREVYNRLRNLSSEAFLQCRLNYELLKAKSALIKNPDFPLKNKLVEIMQ
jgi:hypothetical protein